MMFVPRPHASAFPTYARPTIGDPDPIVPQATAPRAVDPHAAPSRTPTRVTTLSARAATEAACGTLRDTVGALGDAPASSGAADPQDLERWADEGGPLAPTTAGSPAEWLAAEDSAASHRFRRRSRSGAGGAAPSARDAAYAALGAYARALRHDGLPFAAALAALGATVDDAAAAEAAGLLPPALLAAVQRDATQCCRVAFAA